MDYTQRVHKQDTQAPEAAMHHPGRALGQDPQLGHFHWQQVGETSGPGSLSRGPPSLPFPAFRNPQRLADPPERQKSGRQTGQLETDLARHQAGAHRLERDVAGLGPDSEAKQR